MLGKFKDKLFKKVGGENFEFAANALDTVNLVIKQYSGDDVFMQRYNQVIKNKIEDASVGENYRHCLEKVHKMMSDPKTNNIAAITMALRKQDMNDIVDSMKSILSGSAAAYTAMYAKANNNQAPPENHPSDHLIELRKHLVEMFKNENPTNEDFVRGHAICAKIVASLAEVSTPGPKG